MPSVVPIAFSVAIVACTRTKLAVHWKLTIFNRFLVVAGTKRAILSTLARPVIGRTWAKHKLGIDHALYQKMLEEKEEE